MPISTTYIAQIASIFAILFPLIGIRVESDALTTAITTGVIIVSGLWTLKERYKKGDITKLGVRK